MNYLPAIVSADTLDGGELDERHTCTLLGNIVANGSIQYAYLLVVYRIADASPILIVSSELNSTRDAFGGGSHFLCTFDEEGHHNYGDADDWGILEKFLPRALTLVGDHLGLSITPTDKPNDPNAPAAENN